MKNRGAALWVSIACIVAAGALVPLVARLRTPLIHARVPEAGGWGPDVLRAQVGEPLLVRLTSDDVVHGFAVGQSDAPAVEVLPGKVSQTWLEFERAGTYTFYCTRWCGPNHWRMRGTIEVAGGPGTAPPAAEPPLYQELGLDIDRPHPATVTPAVAPDPRRGALIAGMLARRPALSLSAYRAQSPAGQWQEWRADRSLSGLTDAALWDLVAFTYMSRLAPADRKEAARLFAANCAACHGADGDGQGVFAEAQDQANRNGAPGGAMSGEPTTPADFTDPNSMLGASPALLQGKILRGGMGSGMPMWGAILTEDQMWDLTMFLYQFQFDKETPQ